MAAIFSIVICYVDLVQIRMEYKFNLVQPLLYCIGLNGNIAGAKMLCYMKSTQHLIQKPVRELKFSQNSNLEIDKFEYNIRTALDLYNCQ